MPSAFVDCRNQFATIIGEDGGGFLRAGNPHVKALLIDKVGGLAVGMDHHMVGGAALGGKGGIDIGMGDMPVAGGVEVQRLGFAVRGLDRGGACLRVHRDDLAALAIDPARLAVVAGEPDGIAGLEVERLRRERLHLARAPLPEPPIHLAAIL